MYLPDRGSQKQVAGEIDLCYFQREQEMQDQREVLQKIEQNDNIRWISFYIKLFTLAMKTFL